MWPNTLLVISIFSFVLCQGSTGNNQTNVDSPSKSEDANVTSSGVFTSNGNKVTHSSVPEQKKKSLSVRQRLREHLLRDHDKYVHPVTDHNAPVSVGMGMTLMHLDVDEARSVLKVDAWLQISWTNDFLKWNSDEFGNLTMIHMEADEIWLPDILLYNNAEVHSIDLPKVRVLVYNDGRILWVPPAHFESFCKLDLRYWPVDKQTCKLKFGSWTSHGEDIELRLYDNNTEVEKMQIYTDNREWKVIGKPKANHNQIKYPCCVETYEYIDFKFEIERDSPSYRSVIILPCLVLMLTTGSSFLLTPASGEKLLVSGISLVGTILYLIYFANTLPFHQSSVPIIVTFYSNTCGLIGIAILLNVLCISMAREKKYSRPPKFLTRTFSGFLGKLLCLGNYSHQVSHTHQRLTLELSSIDNDEDTHSVHTNYTDVPTSNGRPAPGPATIPTPPSLAPDRPAFHQSANFSPDERGSIIMQDWTMVAAGLERMFFLVYALAFAVVTSVYV